VTEADPDMTAAELALGLLEGQERADALRRVLAEPAFAAEVEWWRDALASLVDEIPEVEPGTGVLARVEASLSSASEPARRGWLWPSVAGLTSLAAAAMLALMVTRPDPQPRDPQIVERPVARDLLAAAITPTKAGDPLSAVYDPGTGTLRLSAAALAGAQRSAELWVIGGDGVPHSLGVLRPGAATALTVAPADRPRIVAAATLAVTVEPLGGSPSGKPTGPVVAAGKLLRT
jgi:anti-sigma-K factor RskA